MTINNLPLVSTTQSQSTDYIEQELELDQLGEIGETLTNHPEVKLWTGDDYNKRLCEKMEPEAWMVECLKMNPGYTLWGPYKDYMDKDDDGGCDNRIIYETWKDFGPWELDDYNEVVNFYFEIWRKSKVCKACDGSGLNKNAKTLFDFWKSNNETFSDYFLSQFELDYLWKDVFFKDFFKEKPTIENFISWSETDNARRELNYWFFCEETEKIEGHFSQCKECKGFGRKYTEPEAKIGFYLWVLHPRKGGSRGIHIKQIRKNELPDVVGFLQEAARRNSERFSKVVQSI